jgi:hypothetical protein
MSPGWWLKVLADKMALRNRELRILRSYLQGNPPLPEGAAGVAEAYREFQRKSRANFAELVVEAPQERMSVTGFRIGDQEGLSKEAQRIWSYNELDTYSCDIHTDMLGLRDGYAIVGPAGSDGIPVITREDPMLMIAEPDPKRPSRMRAALKLYRDEFTGMDTAYLYLPGVVYVATRVNSGVNATAMEPGVEGFEWVPEMAPMRFPAGFEDVVPVIRWHNKGGLSELDNHTDALDRINYTILQRLVVTAMQAYRQRALKGSENIPDVEVDGDGNPVLNSDGKEIPVDLKAMLSPGAGAMWMLPTGVDLWESQYTDITPMLTAAKDDIRILATETRTPIHMLMPDGANQSAEGASAAREGLVFKTIDRMARASYAWNQCMALALRFSGVTVNVTDIETLWAPPERLSLTERADAASKLVNVMPRKSLYTEIMQFSPEKAEAMETEMLGDILVSSLGQDVTTNAV